MHIQRVEELTTLEPLRGRWDQLTGGVMFRSWTWLSTWWQHYGQAGSRRLCVLLVWEGDRPADCKANAQSSLSTKDPEQLVAVLPCYTQQSVGKGTVMRLLGDGEVCSDHLDLLVTGTNAERSAAALADYLCNDYDRWDLIDWPSIDASRDDCKLHALCEALAQRNCAVSRTSDLNCWSIELPDSWEAFLSLQSKSHRKQLRRLEKRVLETDQCQWHQVKLVEEFDKAWEILVDLHQRRRQSLGEPGCFASAGWAAFHRDVARQLLKQGSLRLSWLELAGTAVAAEYHFAGGRTTFVYQGGLDPDRLDEEPGRLSLIRTIQHAIAEGHTKFDLLRGDEPYKPHWRATAKETVRLQVVPNRKSSQLRHRTWTSLRGAATWVRQVSHLFS